MLFWSLPRRGSNQSPNREMENISCDSINEILQ